jgi:hypothetical protein
MEPSDFAASWFSLRDTVDHWPIHTVIAPFARHLQFKRPLLIYAAHIAPTLGA